MKNIILTLLGCLVLNSCSSKKSVSLNFLDEYIIQDSLMLNGFKVGGLSGVDYVNDTLYFVVDDGRKPRVVLATMKLNEEKVDSLDFFKTIELKDSTTTFFNKTYLDVESIFIDQESGRMHITSEGSINYKVKPLIFSLNLSGKDPVTYEIPAYLGDLENHHHNKSFEASSRSFNGKGFWFTTEAPLKQDGELANFSETNSPIRFSYFEYASNKVTKQFVYPLGKIDLAPKGKTKVNGVTAILEYDENKFLVIERAYVSGYGSYGNVVKIFEASISDVTSDTKHMNSLQGKSFQPMEKKLLMNFNEVKSQLTDGIIDNIEGISFGPNLKNGNKSLLLIADDNFQNFGKQLNQFIFLELIIN